MLATRWNLQPTVPYSKANHARGAMQSIDGLVHVRNIELGGRRPAMHRTDRERPLVLAVDCIVPALWHGVRWLAVGALTFIAVATVALAVFRFVDPPGSAVMLWHRLSGIEVRQRWVAIERISPALIRAVIASEDARFCQHWGIDTRELARALRTAERRRSLDIRGASTISMQVVKNLFLWQDKSLLRKGLELAITPLMEVMWPKRRIMEVYLNIAEWAPGVFGAESAARHHFKRSARHLTNTQAALLAAALPNPRRRQAGRPGLKTRRKARIVRARARSIDAAPCG